MALILSLDRNVPGAWCRIGTFRLDTREELGEDYMRCFQEETVKIV